MKKVSVLTLAVGLFFLRAALANPPSGSLSVKCPGAPYPVTWTERLTLDFYGRCATYAQDAGLIFVIVVACGAVLTLYGTVTLLGERVDFLPTA